MIEAAVTCDQELCLVLALKGHQGDDPVLGESLRKRKINTPAQNSMTLSQWVCLCVCCTRTHVYTCVLKLKGKILNCYYC